MPWITPYFSDLTVLRSDAPAKAGPERVGRYVRDSEVVVFEMVERYWAGGHGEMLTDAMLTALERALLPARRTGEALPGRGPHQGAGRR
ncbi:hypothetical protein DQ384_02940 [Sphaerisporangium album]|uniref:Uncharacterized protein n=1 Tax=Sphaerisporangium album TaxID=509200 RepID=A0A367FS04_9ACTN|nr:hypothetical protein [Sphaerisporangium album]RCG32477.1 hypothetical protein DQ384_02940 [Sphaerisporangium album]